MQQQEQVEQMMQTFAEQTKGMYEPLRKLNALWVANLERVIDFQISALKTYSHFGVQQMKRAAEVSDVDSMRDYLSKQGEQLEVISQQILTDTKTMTDMTTQFQQDMGQIFEESRGKFEETVATASKAQKRSTSAKAATKH